MGQWIQENSNKPYPAILSVSARNAYYAKGRHIQMGSINDALAVASTGKVDYIFISHREYKAIAIEEELLQFIKDKKVKLTYKYPEEKSLNRRSMLLYKVLYQ